MIELRQFGFPKMDKRQERFAKLRNLQQGPPTAASIKPPTSGTQKQAPPLQPLTSNVTPKLTTSAPTHNVQIPRLPVQPQSVPTEPPRASIDLPRPPIQLPRPTIQLPRPAPTTSTVQVDTSNPATTTPANTTGLSVREKLQLRLQEKARLEEEAKQAEQSKQDALKSAGEVVDETSTEEPTQTQIPTQAIVIPRKQPSGLPSMPPSLPALPTMPALPSLPMMPTQGFMNKKRREPERDRYTVRITNIPAHITVEAMGQLLLTTTKEPHLQIHMSVGGGSCSVDYASRLVVAKLVLDLHGKQPFGLGTSLISVEEYTERSVKNKLGRYQDVDSVGPVTQFATQARLGIRLDPTLADPTAGVAETEGDAHTDAYTSVIREHGEADTDEVAASDERWRNTWGIMGDDVAEAMVHIKSFSRYITTYTDLYDDK